MNAAEYHARTQSFDRDTIKAQIDRIPYNINRAGKLGRTLIRKIEADHAARYPNYQPPTHQRTTRTEKKLQVVLQVTPNKSNQITP